MAGRKHPQQGPLGKLYPRFAFIMEGDTPSYLGITDNGLNSFRRPDWGGSGGRYLHRQPYGGTHAIWTKGGDPESVTAARLASVEAASAY